MKGNQGIGERIAKVTGHCTSLLRELTDFDAVITKENAAIGRSDLLELENITEEKIIFGEKVKKQIRALKEAMDLLALDIGAVPQESHDERQLTVFVGIVRKKLAAVEPGLEPKLLEMEGLAQKLKDLRHSIFAKVETNAYLVKRLLEYHRETYAFWQAVARESEAVYGQSGKTRASNGQQKSILNVRT